MTKQACIAIDLDESAATTSPDPSTTVVVDEAPGAVVNEEGGLAGDLPRRARRNEDGTVTLPLRDPVTLQIKSSAGGVRSETYAELTLHRLRGGDIRAIQSASVASQPVVLLARSAHIREAVMTALFDRMDAADIADASKVVNTFFENGPTSRNPG